MPGQPLPVNPFSERDHPDAYKAYETCLRVETVMVATPLAQRQEFELIAPRLLGYLLLGLHANGRFDGRDRFAVEVHECEDDDAVIALGQHYNQHFVKAFLRLSGPTPQPSTHPSLPELDAEKAEYTTKLDNASLDHRTAKKHALKRDNYACVISHYQHTDWLLLHPEDYRGCGDAYTDAAHIIPESTSHIISEQHEGGKQHQAGEVWRILSMFAERELPAELNGSGIHRLENIITLTHDVHAKFDRLLLWLKAIPEQHKYRIRASAEFLLLRVPDVVEFPAADGYPLPDGRLIELHALACEVAHMSGTAEYINEIYRDLDETRVLAHDGSSADLLGRALTLLEPGHAL